MDGDRMHTAEFVCRLSESNRQVEAVVAEHLEDYDGEVLLHLLMGDVRRWVVGAFYNQESDREVAAVLLLLDEALLRGDWYVENAVQVSFVEDCAVWDRRMVPFVETWPRLLRHEADRDLFAGD